MHSADVSAREQFAFSEEQVRQILTELVQKDGISGAVLLATCNRTELYLSVQERRSSAEDDAVSQPAIDISPAELLRQYAHAPKKPFTGRVLTEIDAVQHIMEVACGLHSQILHEEQIVTQVGHAVELARACRSTDGVLDTLFRTAVSAGKEAQTQVSVQNVPLSVSYSAVQQLEQHAGTLDGKTCLVIGNGSMGRLAASLLVQHGCRVFMTLRSYHHGETVIPFGVQPVPYEQRFLQMEAAEIVISATRSPHHTITKKQLEALSRKPVWILDLAMPRDVEADCGTVEGVTLWNLDDLHSSTAPDETALAALRQIAEQYTDTFQMAELSGRGALYAAAERADNTANPAQYGSRTLCRTASAGGDRAAGDGTNGGYAHGQHEIGNYTGTGAAKLCENQRQRKILNPWEEKFVSAAVPAGLPWYRANWSWQRSGRSCRKQTWNW